MMQKSLAMSDTRRVQKQNNLVNYNNIVIGSNLSALVYAYHHNFPLILINPDPPTKIDFFSANIDLSSFSICNEQIRFKTPSSIHNIDMSKLYLWQRLSYIMSLSGNLLIPHNVESLSVKDNCLNVFSGQPIKKYNFSFKNLIFFSTDGLRNIEYECSGEKEFVVYDWINIRGGCKHKYDFLESKDNFVKRIYFYPSDRIDGNNNFKDAVAISYLKKDQLTNYNFSDTMVRFKVKKMMKDAGIRGAKNGLNPNYPNRSLTKFKYRPIKTEYCKRQIKEIYTDVKFEDKRFKFIKETAESILKKEKISFYNNKYLREFAKQCQGEKNQ